MQFIQEHIVDITSLKKYVDNDTETPFEKSVIFDPKKEEHEYLPEKRMSIYRRFMNTEIFDLCESIVEQINSKNKTLFFKLVKNDVTHIKYKSGCFFKRHEDYLSIRSNFIEEYSLLICIDANCVGGETIIYLNDNFKYTSKASITPGNSLMFRKDLQHEGSILESGIKEIVTLNLIAFNKTNKNDLLIVSFMNDDRKYFLKISTISKFSEDNVFKRFISFKKNSGINHIFDYLESNYTYEEFSFIADILNGIYVDPMKNDKFEEMISYYYFDASEYITRQITKKDILRKNVLTKDILTYGSQEEYIAQLDLIKKFKLNFIPFKIILVEGVTYSGYDGELEQQKFKMEPIYISIGEENNILMMKNILFSASLNNKITVIDNVNIFSELDVWDANYEYDEFKDHKECKRNETLDYFENGEYSINLLLRNSSEVENGTCLSSSSEHGFGDLSIHKDTKDILYDCSSYVLTSKNILTFNVEHFESIKSKFYELNVVDTIRKNMNNIKFKITQENDISIGYCNESRYGTLTEMIVYGFMKM